MEKDSIKVFVKNEKGTFRRILKKNEYSYNDSGQIVLPKNHYSKGYVERIVSGIKWEEFPYYQTVINKNQQYDKDDIDLDFYFDNISI
jgi:hypothetical protein